MPSFSNVETPKDFFSVTIHPKLPSTLTLLSKLGAKDIFIPVVITPVITKKKIKTSKSNNGQSIAGFKGSIPISTIKRTTNHFPTSLLSIGVSEMIFEIPARFVNKCYPSIPIPLGNLPIIQIGGVSPVNVVSTPVVSSDPTNIVVDSVIHNMLLKKYMTR